MVGVLQRIRDGVRSVMGVGCMQAGAGQSGGFPEGCRCVQEEDRLQGGTAA